MNVLHIIGNLRLGGAQVCLKYLVENNTDKTIRHYIYPLRCKQIDISINADIIKRPFPDYDPRKFLTILKLCKEHNIDIIHTHLHKPVIAGLLAGYFCKARIIIHEHGPVFRKGLQYSLYRFLLKILGHRAHCCIAVSNETKSCLVNKGNIDPDKIKVIYNAVDLDKFQPDRQLRRKVRSHLQAQPEDIIIGFMGRLNDIKGVDLLIKATAQLLKTNSRYLLVLLGDGPRRQSYQNLANELGIANRVIFTGFCPDITKYMNAFDIGAVPSREESFGISAIELMCMNIPVVCSGMEGLGEIITHNETGLITPQNTPDQIAAAIDRLTNDKSLQNKLTLNAQTFCKQFGIKEQVNKISTIYHSILE